MVFEVVVHGTKLLAAAQQVFFISVLFLTESPLNENRKLLASFETDKPPEAAASNEFSVLY